MQTGDGRRVLGVGKVAKRGRGAERLDSRLEPAEQLIERAAD